MTTIVVAIIIIVVIAIIVAVACHSCPSEKFVSKRKKILIISCYGYGNIGDNMYSEVFSRFLNDCEITKLSDSNVMVDKNRKIYRKIPPTDYDFDSLIIGGGGILIADKLINSKNIPYYFEKAKKKGANVYIISCGIQGSTDNFIKDFSLWKEIFDYSKLITVRSPTDKKYIDLLTDPSKVFYYRDLGYIYPHIKLIPRTPKKTTTLILAGPVDCEKEEIKKILYDLGNEVVVMNMGARTDDNNLTRIKQCNFPGLKIKKYYGCSKAKEFVEDLPWKNEYKGSDLDTRKTLKIIRNSELVLTGRYHGMIFSRTLNIPYDTMGMGTNKVLWELPESDPIETIINSYNNIKYLRLSLGLLDNTEHRCGKVIEKLFH